MNLLDIVIIIGLVLGTLSGLRIGLIRTVFSLVGLIIGIVLAGRYYEALAGLLTFIPSDTAAKIIAFILILVTVIVATAIIAGLIRWGVSLITLGWLDNMGGAVFGLVMGALTWGIILAIWVRYFGFSDIINQSFMARLLLDRLPIVLSLLPSDFGQIRRFFV